MRSGTWMPPAGWPRSRTALATVPEGDAAADAGWVGLSGRVRTLVYNPELVDDADLPDSVLDLTAPEYAGQVALAPTNGSFQDFVTVLRDQLGDDEAAAWLDGMAAGDPPTFDNNTAIVEAVGRGEVPMGLVNHYYAFRAKAENPDLPVENHYFPEATWGRRCWSPPRRRSPTPTCPTRPPSSSSSCSPRRRSGTSARRRSSTRWPTAPRHGAVPPFEEISKTGSTSTSWVAGWTGPPR